MVTAALVFAALAALLHVYIFTMESLTWTSRRTRATFGTTAEEAETTKLLAFNQGFYNLFLAIVTGIGKPEPLRGELSGYWSRRIDDQHRLVYRANDEEIKILKARYHY